MAIARSTGTFIGTSESSLQSIANNATETGAEVDVLGDDTSLGEIEVFIVITSTVTAGSINVRVNKRRVTGQAYQKVNFERAITPTNGTQKIPLGRMSASRYMSVDVQNNGTGASASVYVGFELFKVG